MERTAERASSKHMTNDVLAKQLADLPVKLLHHLAKKRVPRHFRMGKDRLIQTLLSLSPDQQEEIKTSLASPPARTCTPSRTSQTTRYALPALPAPAQRTDGTGTGYQHEGAF